MTSPRYVFITYAWYSNYWWVPREDVNCTVKDMEEVLNRSLAILSDPGILNSSEIVDAGIVSILNQYGTLKPICLLFVSPCLRVLLGLLISQRKF